MKAKIAIIGGTGFYDAKVINNPEEVEVKTAYGKVQITIGNVNKIAIAFLARHGGKHELPPHRINYRANIAALKNIGVARILATTAVGSLKKELPPGSIAIIDQFIDFTKNREHTFYDGTNANGVVHTDFTDPYCPQLREILKNVMLEKGITFAKKGTYICTEGPRYETPAEIKAFALWGADVVGMTNVPEVTLAREAGLCYANLSLVTNFAAGISSHTLTHREVVEVMGKKIDLIREIFMETAVSMPAARECCCGLKEDYPLGK
ncbi:MAG: S-methyl-5'-thioadenosine phosphorylase [Firmicutes bacterium]|nr:S-methyl-5'-thioadenosine phosphorylase [Bacillota bacterium]